MTESTDGDGEATTLREHSMWPLKTGLTSLFLSFVEAS